MFYKKSLWAGGANSKQPNLKFKPGLLFATILSFFSITLQAQANTKTLKLFTPPGGNATDSIMLWRPSDSAVYQAPISKFYWSLTGNTGTTAANFIGTTAATDFVIKTNNTERARITSGGDLLLSGSGTANNSGLVFNNLNASTPVSAGATLGVDATGRVITVPGGAFVHSSGQVGGPVTQTIAANATVDIANVILPVPGTYLVVYSVRCQNNSYPTTAGTLCYATAYMKDGSSTLIPNSEVLLTLIQSQVVGSGISTGGTGTGSLIRVVTNPSGETLTLSIKTTNLAFNIFNNPDGRTIITYAKITP